MAVPPYLTVLSHYPISLYYLTTLSYYFISPPYLTSLSHLSIFTSPPSSPSHHLHTSNHLVYPHPLSHPQVYLSTDNISQMFTCSYLSTWPFFLCYLPTSTLPYTSPSPLSPPPPNVSTEMLTCPRDTYWERSTYQTPPTETSKH